MKATLNFEEYPCWAWLLLDILTPKVVVVGRGGQVQVAQCSTILAELGCRASAHRSGCPCSELCFSGAIAVMPLCSSAALAEHLDDLPALGGMPSLFGTTILWLAGFRTFCPDVRSDEEPHAPPGSSKL